MAWCFRPQGRKPAHTEEILAFARAIRENAPSPVPLEQSIVVIGILEAIMKSSPAERGSDDAAAQINPMSTPIHVTVWGENVHEKTHPEVAAIYPRGMHETIAEALRESPGLEVRTAVLEQPEHGLTKQILEETDVLFWWGHCAHGQVHG